jgi:hypothetical protein
MISTDELCERLGRRGLVVTEQTLDNDVHDHYLPGRPWDDWLLARATRLYRLRGLGLRGDVLRLLLFLHDGHGWVDVKPVTLKGLQKYNRATQVGIRETVRNPTPESLAFTAGDAADRQRRHLLNRLGKPETDPMQVRETTMGFIWGQGLFGKPLPQGSLETLGPLVQLFHPEAGEDEVKSGIGALEEILKFTGLTWKNFEELVGQCDEALAREAAREFWSMIRKVRRKVHESIRLHGDPYSSSNPLTLFGEWDTPRAVEFWKRMPERMTPAQMLGASLANSVVIVSFPRVVVEKMFAEMQAKDAPTSNESK